MTEEGFIAELLDLVSWLALTAGGSFYLIGAVGLNRMPDLLTRMHAVSVSETLGAGLLCLGMALQAGASLVTVKLVIVVLALWTAGAVASHALARAALHDGAQPVLAGADGRLAPTDCVSLFPELGPRLAQPLSSEAVETGSAAPDRERKLGPGRAMDQRRKGETSAAASAAADFGMAAMRVNMLGMLGVMRMFGLGAKRRGKDRR